MTAAASSMTPIDKRNLINAILELPENDFLDLLDTRLNRPKGLCMHGEYVEIIDLKDKPSIVERWTEDCLVGQLTLELATPKLLVSHEGKCGITVYKYYNEAFRIFRHFAIARPTPEFVVNLSDLSTRIVAELRVLDDSYTIVKLAVGRIFENIDSERYHRSIASKLKVRIEK